MMERLLKRGQAIGAARAEAAVDALMAKPLPPGMRLNAPALVSRFQDEACGGAMSPTRGSGQ